MCLCVILVVTTARVPRARTDPRRARNRPRGIDPARAAPRTDTNTIHDGETVTPAVRTRARPDDTRLRDSNDLVKLYIRIHVIVYVQLRDNRFNTFFVKKARKISLLLKFPSRIPFTLQLSS